MSKITNKFLAQVPANTLKGNNTGSTANVVDLTITQVKTILAIAGTDVAYTPASPTSWPTTPTTVQGALDMLIHIINTNVYGGTGL
jgi:uncharacterized protein